MFWWLLGAAVFLTCFYFYVNRDKKETQDSTKVLESFIPSDKFSGEKKGYIFKNDSSGVGYYIDTKSKIK